MAEKYQIFISSTYEDLKVERDQVIKTVLEMGHIPVGMEMFSAADEEQWQIIKRHIDESDYYVVVIAHRYGSTTGGVSYTRKEHDYAREQGIPTLGFIIDPAASWPADRVDSGQEKDLLDDFKALVGQKPVGFWKSVDDLPGKFSIALSKAFTATPRPGWIRATAGVDPKVTSELSRLSSENAGLRSRLESVDKEVELDRERAFEKLRATLRAQSRELQYRYDINEDWLDDADPVTLSGVFAWIAPMLIPEHTVDLCASYIALNIRKDELRRPNIIPINMMKDLLTELMAFDLVAPSRRQHSLKDPGEYWAITEYGESFLKWLTLRRFQEQDLPSKLKTPVEEADETNSDDSPSTQSELDEVTLTQAEADPTPAP